MLLKIKSAAFSFCKTCPFNIVILTRGTFVICLALFWLVELERSNTDNSGVLNIIFLLLLYY